MKEQERLISGSFVKGTEFPGLSRTSSAPARLTKIKAKPISSFIHGQIQSASDFDQDGCNGLNGLPTLTLTSRITDALNFILMGRNPG